MSYNQGYGQNNPQGYGQYHPYGQPNRYNQRDDDPSQGGYNSTQGYNTSSQAYSQGNQYAQQGGYNQQRPGLQQQSSSQYNDESTQGGYEMGAVGNDPNRILNEVRQINGSIAELEQEQQKLEPIQKRTLNQTDQKVAARARFDLGEAVKRITSSYRLLLSRVQSLKNDHESGNPRNKAQVGMVERTLKNSFNKLQKIVSDYDKEHRKQIGRDVLYTKADATEEEIRRAQETGEINVFAQALMNTDRRGEAQAAANEVRNRHNAIQKLHSDIIMLSELFQDLDAATIQQESQIAAIEDKAEVAEEHVAQGTVQLDGAIVKAKAARKKKWICLGICVLIIIIVVAVAVGVVESRPRAPSS